uniref:(northern house mosquito) hypothetical protein n=1 Tax=Culex pipiens TaxID=7175 RepID=A0A8D8P7G1_CULPI
MLVGVAIGGSSLSKCVRLLDFSCSLHEGGDTTRQIFMVAFRKSSRFFRTFTRAEDCCCCSSATVLTTDGAVASTGVVTGRSLVPALQLTVAVTMVGAVSTVVAVVVTVGIGEGEASLVGVGDLESRGGTGGTCPVGGGWLGGWVEEDLRRRDRLRRAGTVGVGADCGVVMVAGEVELGELEDGGGGEFFMQHPDMLLKFSIKGLLLLWSIGFDCWSDW